MGCTFEGPYWAHYPDATCIDGYLWDLDSCDEPGGPLSSGGDVPCPHCNSREHAKYHAESQPSGNARQRRTTRRATAEMIRTNAEAWT